jgi:hypothetical protein
MKMISLNTILNQMMQTMKQNNINIQNEVAMRNILELFKNKQRTEERPKITIKINKPFTPTERERFNQWCKELNVSALWDDNKLRLG